MISLESPQLLGKQPLALSKRPRGSPQMTSWMISSVPLPHNQGVLLCLPPPLPLAKTGSALSALTATKVGQRSVKFAKHQGQNVQEVRLYLPATTLLHKGGVPGCARSATARQTLTELRRALCAAIPAVRKGPPSQPLQGNTIARSVPWRTLWSRCGVLHVTSHSRTAFRGL